MSKFKLKVPRTWQLPAVAMLIGILASVITLQADDIEVAVRMLFHKPKGNAEALPPDVRRQEFYQRSAVANFYNTFDTSAYDWLFERRGPHKTSPPNIPEVVIIQIDATAIKNMETQNGIRYPFPRRVHGELVRRLKRAGAAVIGLDITFTAPSEYNRSQQDPDDDREFAKALRDAENVVLAAKFLTSRRQNANVEETGSDFPINVFVSDKSDPRDAPIRNSARASRPADIPTDNKDGAIRRFHLSASHGDPDDLTVRRDYLGFAPTVAALYWMNTQPNRPKFQTIQQRAMDEELAKEIINGKFLGKQLRFLRPTVQSYGETPELPPVGIPDRDLHIQSMPPLDRMYAEKLAKTKESNSLTICFAGYPSPSSCSLMSYDQALDPANEAALKSLVNGKIVLVGSMLAEEHADAQSTPLKFESDEVEGESGVYGKRFGVDVHANIIHTLLSGHYYRTLDDSRQTLLVWTLGIVVSLITVRFRPVRAFPIMVLLFVGIFMMLLFAFNRYYVIQPSHIVTVTLLSYLTNSVYFYGVENRRVQKVRGRFQRYVGKRVLQTILDTDFVFRTVEKRYCTIMFTDVQGFTSLSEKVSPEEIVALLNKYLDQMAEIIEKYNGTLDKIMGDGIMAYFGAPMPVDKHEQNAVQCAIEMQYAMQMWRSVSDAQGVPPLKVRIGINAGEVVVGEIGAREQVGFTVIGDAVNTAARLEPLNKEYGTQILISEQVKNNLDDSIQTEFVGELEIRGRKEGIRAYSVPVPETKEASKTASP